jgi:hypothetical protein
VILITREKRIPADDGTRPAAAKLKLAMNELEKALAILRDDDGAHWKLRKCGDAEAVNALRQRRVCRDLECWQGAREHTAYWTIELSKCLFGANFPAL